MKKNLRRNTTILFSLLAATGLAQAVDPGRDGLYVGVNALWGFDGNAQWKFPADGGTAGLFSPQTTGGAFSQSPRGNGWGFHLGENRQFGNLVVGVEASYAWTDIDATKNLAFVLPGTTGLTHTSSIKSLATLTPRVGYAIGNWLPYAKAGLALAEVEARMGNTSGVNSFSFNRKHLHGGWTAGVGVEYALPADTTGAWVFGLEYNYYQFSGKTYGGQSVPDSAGWPAQFDLKPSSSTLILRASYNFGAHSRPGSGGSSSGGAWDGIYAGIDTLWGFDGDAKWKFPRDGGAFGAFSPQVTGGTFSQSPEGNGWGFHIGENRQYDNLVVGIEASYAEIGFQTTTTNPFPGVTSTARSSIKSLTTLTPKVGYAFGDWLPYAKAGLALAEVEAALHGTNFYSPPIPIGTPLGFARKHLHGGWMAGVGVEYVLPLSTGNMLLGIEYDYYQLSGKTYGGQPVPDSTYVVQFDLRPSFSTLMARLSYKF